VTAVKCPKSDSDLRRSDAIGLALIVGYKIVKGILELLGGVMLLLWGSAGFAEEIRRHLTEAWSVALAERLVQASTAQNLFVVVAAVTIDGALALIEGWALHRRYPWSRWLVVGATSIFLPFEVVMLTHHPSAGRALLLLLNLLVVVYLLLRRRQRIRLGTSDSGLECK
jgi:uncharacterized membrane protein (DUF2068 family)